MSKFKRVAVISLILYLVANTLSLQSAAAQETRFEIVFPEAAHHGPVTGRAYAIISRTAEIEPRFQVRNT